MGMLYKDNKEKQLHLNTIRQRLLSNDKFVDIDVDSLGVVLFKKSGILSTSGSVLRNKHLGTDSIYVVNIEGYYEYDNVYKMVEEYYNFNFMYYVRNAFVDSQYYCRSSVNFISENTVEIKNDKRDLIHVKINDEAIYIEGRQVRVYDTVTCKEDADDVIKKFFHVIETCREYLELLNYIIRR